ncbi:hypothetical protein EDC04DRAFT_2573093, partial [Pisolithus marmoratus]
YALQDECNILYLKANALYWVKALLQMTYQFIDCAIKEAKGQPPFEVPCLHFVDAGLLFAYSDMPLATATVGPVRPRGMVSVAYLVKEFIPALLGEFVKYIHNGNAAPCFLMDMKAEEITDFLAFTQHVQYMKTGGQVYISDYQGMCGCHGSGMYLHQTREWVTFDRSSDPHTSIGTFLKDVCGGDTL